MNLYRVMFGKKPTVVWDELDPAPARGPGRLRLTGSQVLAFVISMSVTVLACLIIAVAIFISGYDYAHRYPARATNDGNGIATFSGEYWLGDGRGWNVALSILPDGRYSFRWLGCMGVCGRESGFVKRVGDYLVLSPVEPFEPRMKRVLLPVKWGRRTYLIPPEELKKFSDAVIEGDEPRSEDAHGRFYMRGPDGRVGGTPELPEPWATYLRKNAVIGMIVEVGEGGRARIDLGSAHGINARSILTVQGREHLSGRQLKTVAVDARSCAVEHVYAPGDYGIPLEVGCTVVGARATGEKVDTGGEGAR